MSAALIEKQVSRSYRQFCGLARALDLLGERWTLLLVRELLLGATRYGALLEALPGITTNLLAARLKRLESAGVVARTEGGRWALTASGLQLEGALMELARWGGRFLSRPGRGERVDVAWGLLSLKRRYRGGVSMTVAVQAGEAWFGLNFTPTWLEVWRGRPDSAQATLHATLPALFSLLWERGELRVLMASGQVRVDGEVRVVRRALRALSPPEFAHRAPPPFWGATVRPPWPLLTSTPRRSSP